MLTPTLPSTRGNISGSDVNKVPADAARPMQEDFDKELVVFINMTKTKTENNEDKYQTYVSLRVEVCANECGLLLLHVLGFYFEMFVFYMLKVEISYGISEFFEDANISKLNR